MLAGGLATNVLFGSTMVTAFQVMAHRNRGIFKLLRGRLFRHRFSSVPRNESNVNMITNLISFPMLFTSEAFYSLQHAPKWVQILGNMQPFHYFVGSLGAAAKPMVKIITWLRVKGSSLAVCLLGRTSPKCDTLKTIPTGNKRGE